MKIELIFSKRSKGFDLDETLSLGFFRTYKSAYQYVKSNRKFFCDGYFTLCIHKNNDYFFQTVLAKDLLSV